MVGYFSFLKDRMLPDAGRGVSLSPGVLGTHPHLHFLVTEGGTDRAGIFHLVPRID